MANGVNRTRRDKKSYTFTMSMSDVVWTGVGAVFALTVFFLFGVLVGRGYLPTGEVVPVQQTGEAAPGVEVSTHGQVDAKPAEQAAEVLKPEELAYQDQLDKPEAGGTSSDQAAQPEPAEAKTPESDKHAAEEKATGKAAEETATSESEAAVYDPANLPAPEPGEKPYHYTYQAAAFKDKAAATSLADKLKTKGIPAKVTEGKTTSATWYRVQIPFTGTPTQTRPLRDAIEEVTGERPVMVSKKSAQ